MSADTVTSIQEYLELTTKARGKWIEEGKIPAFGYYLCMEDFVLQEGIQFDHFSPRAGKYQRGYPKACFHNAYLLASRARGKLTYVEGYAYGSALAVHHAWCMDSDQGVVDPTWTGSIEVQADSYMGIPFPIEAIREVRSRESTMIDDWPKHWPLLQEKYEREI